MDVYYFIVSAQFSRSAVSDSLQPHEPQHRETSLSINSQSLPKLVHWVGDAI